MKKWWLLIWCCGLFLVACSNSGVDDVEERKEIYILAAASLTDALDELKADYEAKHHVSLTYVYGGSGKLAQQIEQGAPADVFISANEAWMDTLASKDLLQTGTRVDITGNKLVLIAQADTAFDYDRFEQIDGAAVSQIAIGNPESVPAGAYAEEVLKDLKKWDALHEQFVYAQDVRQVLTYVQTGNADIGFVYESDTVDAEGITVLASADVSKHEPIVYPAAVLAESANETEAQAFIDYLQSEAGQAILQKYGFHKEK